MASHEKVDTKGYVIDDGEAYGRGVALLFSRYFTAAGGTVVNGTSQSLPSGTTTYATQVSDAQSKGAQFIFFGGTTSGGCGNLRGAPGPPRPFPPPRPRRDRTPGAQRATPPQRRRGAPPGC